MTNPMQVKGLGAKEAVTSPQQRAATKEQVHRAARGFEEMLLQQMLQAMTRAQLEGGGFFGGGSDGGTRQTTFELLLTQSLAETEPFGMAKEVAKSMGRQNPLAEAERAVAPGAAEMLGVGGPTVPVFRNFTSETKVHRKPSEEDDGFSRTVSPKDHQGLPGGPEDRR